MQRLDYADGKLYRETSKNFLEVILVRDDGGLGHSRRVVRSLQNLKDMLKALRSDWRGVGDEDGKVNGEQMVKYLV